LRSSAPVWWLGLRFLNGLMWTWLWGRGAIEGEVPFINCCSRWKAKDDGHC
jgi:hypothetical protein